ncbi:hypothetical protein OKW76_11860 [Sphingomonas sp. S1-29]|nr:hypothetical protein [Sphingomonas sp. S1-29]UZK68731.1 hypothetical protein OKW76_11860 [Sphingomonas sp. S1-29]
MLDVSREVIAYGLLSIMLLVGGGMAFVVQKRRKREKLRRRGIKHYGH